MHEVNLSSAERLSQERASTTHCGAASTGGCPDSGAPPQQPAAGRPITNRRQPRLSGWEASQQFGQTGSVAVLDAGS